MSVVIRYFRSATISLFGLSFCFFPVGAQEIKLPASKVTVVATSVRKTVLEVGARYLEPTTDEAILAFKASIDPVQNPFTSEDELAVVSEVSSTTSVAPKQAVKIVYDDAAILEAVATSMSKQVTGTLSRGTSQYLQLQGGALLKSGATFPARIPGLEGQGTYNVLLSDISVDAFKLTLGTDSLVVPMAK
jgi:hypothetical protein